MKIYEKAPAKINLMLDVLHKRPDGFHEVEMVMTMIDLADRLEMSEQKRDTIIITSQAGYIPLDEKNLAFQAARLIKERYDVRKGVHIHLDKKFPLPRDSQEAAAMRRPRCAADRLWGSASPSGSCSRSVPSSAPMCRSA